MNIALISDIPEIFKSVFAELTVNSGKLAELSSAERFFIDLKNGLDYAFIVLNFEKFLNNLEETVQSIKLASPLSKLLVFGCQDTGTTIKLMRHGVDFCFTAKMPPEQLKEYLLQTVINAGSAVNQNMHKHRWFVGESVAIRNLKKSLNDAVNSNKYIIISGPVGTGKSNMARIIHECGPQRAYQFKSVNLSAYNHQYLENQFWITFKNLFEEIDSDIEGLRDPVVGSIYIEHIEEQSIDFLYSLLNMIDQSYKKNRKQSHLLAPRILLPWSSQLETLTEFPGITDFFYLLKLPSLLERQEDIPLLIYTLVSKYSEKYNKQIKNISLEAFNMLMNYDWPGNILELQSTLECAVLTTQSDTVGVKDIGITMSMLYQVSQQNVLGMYVPLNISIQKYQHALISAVLETAGYDMDASALFLGLNKNELFNKMKLLNISTDVSIKI